MVCWQEAEPISTELWGEYATKRGAVVGETMTAQRETTDFSWEEQKNDWVNDFINRRTGLI